MLDSVHQEFRSRLNLLAGDAAPQLAIAAVAGRQAWASANWAWQRVYGRFQPDRSPYAALLYEANGPRQDLCRVEVFQAKDRDRAGAEPALVDPVLGTICVTRFPSDAALPALAPMLAELPGAKIVRYRSGKRCVIRVAENGRTRFAKLFSDERGAYVHRAGVTLWQAAREHRLGFKVAQPLGWDSQARTLWQEEIAGAPIMEQLKSSAAIPLAHRLGGAAATLTNLPIVPEEIFGGAAQLERSQRYASLLRRWVPALAPALDRLLAELAEIHAVVGARELRPIHGAPHAHQWLDDGVDLGLVDFDRMALGDPELDAATFLAEMDSEGQLQVPMARLAESFVSSYRAAAGPLDERLLKAYRAHKRLAKVVRTARALRPDGDARAERHLKRASEALSGGRQ